MLSWRPTVNWQGIGLLSLALCTSQMSLTCHADTIVPGGIVSGNWDQTGSPYRIQASVTVSGVLKLAAGTVVLFNTNSELVVNGSGLLSCVGERDSPIRFGADRSSPTPGDWLGIRYSAAQSNNLMRFVIIEHAVNGISLVAGGNQYSRATLDHVEIRLCSQHGVYIYAKGSSAQSFSNGRVTANLTDCLLHDNWGCGLYSEVYNGYLTSTGTDDGGVQRCTIRNNLLSGASYVGGGDHRMTFLNNVVWSNGQAGISYPLTRTEPIRNNIVAGNATGVLCNGSSNPVVVAFNDVWSNGQNWVGPFTNTPSRCYANSSMDPLFADATNGDFHLRSSVGRWLPGPGGGGSWVTDMVHSPCIDAGYFLDAYENETCPNGSRIDIGIYGNTPEASLSYREPHLRKLSPVRGKTNENAILCTLLGSDLTRVTNVVLWHRNAEFIYATNLVHHSTSRLDCEFNLIGAGPGDFDLLAQNPDGSQSRLSWCFQVVNNEYYVNDASTAGDAFTTVPGNDAYSGTSPSAPKATLISLLANVTLTVGDIVYCDAGTYPMPPVTIASGGNDNGYAVIAGVHGKTALRQQNGSYPTYLLTVNASIKLLDLVVSNTCVALSVGGGSLFNCADCTFQNTPGSGYPAMVVDAQFGYDSMDRCLLTGGGIKIGDNTKWPTVKMRDCIMDAGVYGQNGTLDIANCTLGASYIYRTTVIARNCLVLAPTAVTGCFRFDLSTPAFTGDNNCYYVTNAQALMKTGTNLLGMAAWRALAGNDTHSIQTDPILDGPGSYRLSKMSPCIDAGNAGATSSAHDYDGLPRVLGYAPDIGACEYPASIVYLGTLPSAVDVSWQSATRCAYWLQTTPRLAPSPAWSNVTEAAIIGNDDMQHITNLVVSGSAFYRLVIDRDVQP